MGAARGSIKTRASALASGNADRVFPGWAGFSDILTDGLTLIYCSWWVPSGQANGRIGAGCPNAVTALATDSEILTSLALLDALAPRSPHTARYIDLYRQVIAAFDRILADQRGLVDAADTAFVAAALHNSGFASLDNLDLDGESVDWISRLLLAGQE
jgi:hypothetical protein